MTAIADHLWQSTLCAVGVALLVSLLRQHRAVVRYWLWCAASGKFLVPWATLVALGERFPWRAAPASVPWSVEAAGHPLASVTGLLPAAAAAGPATVWANLIATLWLAGSVSLLCRLAIRWRRATAIAATGQRVLDGREFGILRRVEAEAGSTRPLHIVVADTSLEPGILGVFCPTLLWPRGLSEHLTDRQIAAIVRHELVHVRRRDNLIGVFQACIESALWWHPLIWVIGTRMLVERERACDEEVVGVDRDTQTYAESILKTCAYCVAPRLAGVSGVAGADLRDRIEAIVTNRPRRRLVGWQRLVVVSACVLAMIGPLAIGLLRAPYVVAAQTLDDSAAFDVASVKPHEGSRGASGISFSPSGRFGWTGMTLKQLLPLAYAELESKQIVGGPQWIDSDRFDIVATSPDALQELGPGGEPRGVFRRLRTLLEERFQLKTHVESQVLSVYELVGATSPLAGRQLHAVDVNCQQVVRAMAGAPPPASPQPGQFPQCALRVSLSNVIGRAITMRQLASALSSAAGRPIIDRTGQAGVFDVDLDWTPEFPPGALLNGASPPPRDGPSVFTALREQLGLRLESARTAVRVLVIDSVQPPTPN